MTMFKTSHHILRRVVVKLHYILVNKYSDSWKWDKPFLLTNFEWAIIDVHEIVKSIHIEYNSVIFLSFLGNNYAVWIKPPNVAKTMPGHN